ncbi:MAG: tRNA dihydrouridine synthase, partial [Planctomycetota bacterium]
MTVRAAPRRLSIGGVDLAAPVVQAALSGYSDRAMRVLARRHGAAYSLGEVLLDQFVATVGSNRRNLARLAVADEEHPVGGQLMGSNPDDFPPAARRLVTEGYDVIDINFGCPVKKVLGRCRGGYLLSQPAIALEIVARVRDAVPPQIPVTLKMRRGLDDSSESLANFWTIFDGAFARGAAAVTVHGRTVQQKYVG